MAKKDVDCSLNPSEMEVMETFWQQDRPLCGTEILKLLPNRTWLDRTRHVLLNSLIDKNLIEPAGNVRITRLEKLYKASVTKAEFKQLQMKKQFETMQTSPVKNVMAAFASTREKRDPEFVKEIDDWLESYKKSLGLEEDA